MRITMNNLTRVVAMFGLAMLLSGVVGCRSTPDRTSGQVMSDRTTSRRVKKALDEAPIFKYPDVSATAYQGTVQLTGFVDTEEQRIQAAQVAAGVKGVNQVINEIMIKPTPSPTGRAIIRDPLGNDIGRVMLDTNAPPLPPIRLRPDSKSSAPSAPAPSTSSPSTQPAPESKPAPDTQPAPQGEGTP